MRLRAAQKLGYKEVPVIIMQGLDLAAEREIAIKDNGSFGEWDYDALANSWDGLPLSDWGLDLPEMWSNNSDDTKAGASPWDRVGDGVDGVILNCGSITIKITHENYNVMAAEFERVGGDEFVSEIISVCKRQL